MGEIESANCDAAGKNQWMMSGPAAATDIAPHFCPLGDCEILSGALKGCFGMYVSAREQCAGRIADGYT